MSKIIDIIELFDKVLGDKIEQFDLPPPSFTVMQGEIIVFDDVKKSLTIKIPVFKILAKPLCYDAGRHDNSCDRQCCWPT